jgi:hypothetical protein
MMMHALVVLTVGEKDDAGDGVLVPAAVEHHSGHVEAVADVGAAGCGERLHRALGRGLPVRGHARQPDDAVRVRGEGDDAEAVAGAEVVDEERHGALHQLQIVALHAAADVEHSDEIQRRPRRRRRRRLRRGHRGRLGVHEHPEPVACRGLGERRVLAVRLEHQQPGGRGGGSAASAA